MTLGGGGGSGSWRLLCTLVLCGTDRVAAVDHERRWQTTLFGTVAGASTDCIYATPKNKYERFIERWYQRHKGTRLKQELVKEALVIWKLGMKLKNCVCSVRRSCHNDVIVLSFPVTIDSTIYAVTLRGGRRGQKLMSQWRLFFPK